MISSRIWRVLAAALVSGACALFAATAPATVQSTERLEGTLTVVWGDPPAGMPGGAIRFTLTLPDGTAYPLRVGAGQRNVAIRNFGKPVIVQGRKLTDTSGRRVIAVSRILPGVSENTPAPPPVTTKRSLYILLRYSGDSQQPHSPQFYLDLTNPKTPVAGSNIPATINGFFSKTSWNHLLWQADVAGVGGLKATGWLTLPYGKSHYANCGSSQSCAQVNTIAADGMNLAVRQGVDVSVYSTVNFVLNDDLDCCSWGGTFLYKNVVYHGTWEAPWGQDTSYYAHELGHALGLPHSGWAYYPYDSPWDVMSMHVPVGGVECGRYLSANNGGKALTLTCAEPGDGYNAAYKDYLHWIPSANELVITGKTSQTVTVEANAWPRKTLLKLIKICLPNLSCTGKSAHYITVESRIHSQVYEKGEPGDGVLIQDFQGARKAISGGCFYSNQSGWAMPIDATPGDYDSTKCNSGGRRWPNYALGNAVFKVGQTYTNRTYGISVAVLKSTSSTFTVQVTRSQ